jgi:hypothetical protein
VESTGAQRGAFAGTNRVVKEQGTEGTEWN